MQIKPSCIKWMLSLGVVIPSAIINAAPIAITPTPITIEADRASMYATAERTEFNGHVVVKQDGLRLEAEHLVVDGQKSKTAVITAYGQPASFVLQNKQQRVTGHANEMVFQQKEQILILAGQAKVSRGQDSVSGQRILYHLRTDHYQVESPNTGERVRVILHPQKD